MKKLIICGFITLTLAGCGNKAPDKNQSEKQKSELNQSADKQKNIASQSTKIDPKMDIVDLATCTAASMKIGQGIGVYKVWTEELTNRYRKTYPSKSESEISNYVSERIDDKLRYLKSKGLDSQISFTKFYDLNCKD